MDNKATGNRQWATGKNYRSIEVQIDALVLHGFAPSDRHRIGEAVERELARLMSDQGISSALIQKDEIRHLDGGEFQSAPGSPAAMIGAQIARSIHDGLNRQQENNLWK